MLGRRPDAEDCARSDLAFVIAHLDASLSFKDHVQLVFQAWRQHVSGAGGVSIHGTRHLRAAQEHEELPCRAGDSGFQIIDIEGFPH